MEPRFRKRSDLSIVILPGIGKVRPTMLLRGEEFRKFVPRYLEEVVSEPEVVPVVRDAPAEEEFVEEGDLASFVSEGVLESDDPPRPTMAWLRADLVKYAKGLGLDVKGRTKAQIMAAIRKVENDEVS